MAEPSKDRLLVQLTEPELAALIERAVAAALKGMAKEDRLLTVEQTAEILAVEKNWLYHNAKALPFTRKVGGMLRFSAMDLQRWIAGQRLRNVKTGG